MTDRMCVFSPVGPLILCADAAGLRRVEFGRDGAKYEAVPVRGEGYPYIEKAKEWLERYFSGERMEVPVQLLCPEGTDFQMRVWEELIRLPYGSTVTYGELARRESICGGKTVMSAQAVGQAVHHNPIAILIPCHRVVGSGGSLTGYGGGLDRKRLLLELERSNVR